VRLVPPTCIVVLVLAECMGGGGGSGSELERGPSAEGFELTAAGDVTQGTPIDARFTCDGADLAPTLGWKGVPDGTAELAVVLEDPDAPGGTFTHWLAYGIDPAETGLPGEFEEGWTGYAPLDVREGENDSGNVGYGGPCPPGGEEHRYVFRLLALDAAADLEAGADREAWGGAGAPPGRAAAPLSASYARG
jgi:Raf kinase inhibitor-like YbhB/YbcL family protein